MLPSSPGSRDAQLLVDKYQGFIDIQFEENAQPANKFSQVEQYGVASANHAVSFSWLLLVSTTLVDLEMFSFPLHLLSIIPFFQL